MFNAIKLNIVEVNFITFIGLILYLALENPISTQTLNPTQVESKQNETELTANVIVSNGLETPSPKSAYHLNKT